MELPIIEKWEPFRLRYASGTSREKPAESHSDHWIHTGCGSLQNCAPIMNYACRMRQFRGCAVPADKQKGELSVSEQLALFMFNVALVIQISSRRFNRRTVRSRRVKSARMAENLMISAFRFQWLALVVRLCGIRIRLSRPVMRPLQAGLRCSPGSTLARGNFASKVERLKFQQRPERYAHGSNLQSADIRAFEDVSLVFRFSWLRPASGHPSSFFGVFKRYLLINKTQSEGSRCHVTRKQRRPCSARAP